MPVLSILLALVIFGVILWLVNTDIPMALAVKKIVNIVVVIFLVLWLFHYFGLLGALEGMRVR